MSREEQEARRALKARRKALDRIAEDVAAYGKRAMKMHTPSTRSKQSKLNHEQAGAINSARNQYRRLVDDINQIAVALGRTV